MLSRFTKVLDTVDIIEALGTLLKGELRCVTRRLTVSLRLSLSTSGPRPTHAAARSKGWSCQTSRSTQCWSDYPDVRSGLQCRHPLSVSSIYSLYRTLVWPAFAHGSSYPSVRLPFRRFNHRRLNYVHLRLGMNSVRSSSHAAQPSSSPQVLG